MSDSPVTGPLPPTGWESVSCVGLSIDRMVVPAGMFPFGVAEDVSITVMPGSRDVVSMFVTTALPLATLPVSTSGGACW